MRGVLYINDQQIGPANLEMSFGRGREINLAISSGGRRTAYSVSDGDVYVNGTVLGIRGYAYNARPENESGSGVRGKLRPVMTTFELVPAKQSWPGLARRVLVSVQHWLRSCSNAVFRSGANDAHINARVVPK